MDPYQETFETWDKLAALYQEKFMDLDLYDGTYAAFCAAVSKQGARILEIGCGPGNISRFLLRHRPDFDLFGIDIAPSMVALAQKNNPTARFAVMDSRDLDQLDARYDGIVCGFCLPYLSSTDCDKLLADCAGLLEHQGWLYLSFVEGNPADSGFQTGSSGARAYFYYHDLEEVKRQLATHHFDRIEVVKVQYARSATVTEEHTVVMGRRGIDGYLPAGRQG
jgi:2-polyprenyl-3-methyl-5-hydroxy-6-metoxy-1,4-benzoquinol methylase